MQSVQPTSGYIQTNEEERIGANAQGFICWLAMVNMPHQRTSSYRMSVLIYLRLLDKKMNDHMENFDSLALERIKEGKDPLVRNAWVGGCPNS